METYIKRAKKGDIEAFINLMDINKTYMYKVAKSILNNNEDIADAIQETILSCYKNIEKLKEIKYFKTWMTRILINKCNALLKKNKKICCLPININVKNKCIKNNCSILFLNVD